MKADKNNPFHLGSSIPGTISKILVKEGEEVKKNQPVLTVEAMKMETSIVAKEDGVIYFISMLLPSPISIEVSSFFASP